LFSVMGPRAAKAPVGSKSPVAGAVCQSGFEGLQGRIRANETCGKRPDSCVSEMAGEKVGETTVHARGASEQGDYRLDNASAVVRYWRRREVYACIQTISISPSYLPPPRSCSSSCPLRRQGLALFARSLLHVAASIACSPRHCPSRGWTVPCIRSNSLRQTRKHGQPSCATDQALPPESPTSLSSRRV
jgi:hypothetical protein